MEHPVPVIDILILVVLRASIDTVPIFGAAGCEHGVTEADKLIGGSVNVHLLPLLDCKNSFSSTSIATTL